jgi:propionyl-CoA carboxylase alpha chain
VLRHESFIAGETPTNFIPLHYPDGFSGVSLSAREKSEVAAIACVVSRMKGEVLDRPPLPCLPTSGDESSALVVCLGGLFGTPFLVQYNDDKINVSEMVDDGTCESEIISIDVTEFEANSRVISVRVDGEDRVIQLKSEDSTGSYEMRSNGADFNVIVMSPEEYKLCRNMHKPHKVDTTHLILSPMPGTLISYSVKDGDSVVDGQDICIVEAMKMQNIIRSPRSGVIKKCHATVGSSLMTDEVIVEYE